MDTLPRPWTADEVAQLRALVDKGFSANQIGRILHKTRNSVIGKCHRMVHKEPEFRLGNNQNRGGGHRDGHAKAPPSKPSPYRKRIMKAAKQKRAAIDPPKVSDIALRTEAPKWAPRIVPVAVDPLMLAIYDLNKKTCRFPIGDPKQADFGYCGHALVEAPYCEHHSAIAFLPVEPRRRS